MSEEIKCTKCGEEAHTNAEFISGKCRFFGGELEEEKGDDSTASDLGLDIDF